MSACKWMADMLLTMFTVYLFFLYFGMFFERRKKNIRVLLGVIVLVLWQVGIPEVINELPKAWNIGTTVGLALFVVANVFEGKAWMKSFFAVTFAAIWMLAEMLIGSVLMIYGESIVERQIFGAFASRFLFFLIILALRKVFTNEKVTGLPTGYSILIIFIPTGSIYIMNAVFVLAYRTDWEYAEGYSLVSGLILLFINVLIFYIYIRLADDLRIRRMNLVYEQQLDLCARHQEERELSVLQMRDVRHGMRNHLLFGAFASRFLFFLIILALRKVFTNEKVTGLPTGYSILIIFIPTGSIYIMNAVFVLAYRTDWEYAEGYSLVSGLILLFINVLIFYIYIRLADDLRIRRMNLVYEQQLDLCARHQEERELSVLQMRDVRHGMRNHLLSILAYAERGEREKLIQFVTDIIEDGRLRPSEEINTGNIVTDSLVGYWKKKAEDAGIEFLTDLSIPMEMPFRGADISLIMGNLLENAVEGAGRAEGRKYIRLKMKYDKNNLLITIENSYRGKLAKGKGEELRTTKTDTSNHGIGLPSVRRAADKYQGVLSVDTTEPGRFLARVVLYGS